MENPGRKSCYAFDYSMMVEKGLVTLEEDLTLDADKKLRDAENNQANNKSEDDDLPF